MKKTITILLIALTAMTIAAAPLSLEDARARALAANLDLRTQQAAQNEAMWNYRGSLFGLLPSASLSGSYTYLDPVPGADSYPAGTEPEDNSISYGVQVSLPLFVGGARWLGSRIKRDALLMADQSLLSTRLEVVATVESKYYAVLEARELLRNAEKDLEVSRRNLESTEVRWQTGTLSRADLLQLQSEAAGKEVSLIQMRNLLEVSRLDLANYLQLPADFTLEPVPLEGYQPIISHLRTLDATATDNLADRLIAAGLGSSPSLKLAELGEASGEKALLIARGAFLPTVSLVLSKDWTDDTNPGDDFTDQGTLLLSASLPLFPLGDTYSAERSARRSLQQASLGRDAAEDNLRLGMRSAVLSLVAAAQTVRASQTALDFAEETYAQMEERYRNNLVSTSDLLSAEVLLQSSRNQYTTSVYDFLRARSGLAQLMGVADNELDNWLR